MSARPDRITLALIAGAVAVAGCSSAAELQTAQHSIYDIDFAIVYREAMSAVQKLYPNFQEDAGKGLIQTSWHQVAYASTGNDDAARGSYVGGGMGGGNPMGNPTGAGGAMTAPAGPNNGTMLTQRYFIRFDVSVIGGRPWRVHVVGHASEWDPGNAVPTELHGANTPHWLAGRTDELTVAIYQRLQPYAKQTAEEIEEPKPEEAPVDTRLFGEIPAPAAKAAAAVERAIERRDYGALRAAVADDVLWSLGADPGADAALAMWQADPSTLDTLVASMKAGCAGDDKKIVCPAKAATDGYLGWRVTLEPRGGAWKLTSFVQVE